MLREPFLCRKDIYDLWNSYNFTNVDEYDILKRWENALYIKNDCLL